ncbi:MAG: flagellar biosynthesis protein FlhF [Planctomycetes bacterium]|nr:flagellar biosynthesis protein FlhF [Planctomycetota bacterium]
MQVKTYRAKTMQQALNLVRRELGPDAAVLHTREIRSRWMLNLLPGPTQIEVTASADVTVPSRLPAHMAVESEMAAAPQTVPTPIDDATSTSVDENHTPTPAPPTYSRPEMPPSRVLAPPESAISSLELDQFDASGQQRSRQNELAELRSRVAGVQFPSPSQPPRELPEALFALFTDLIEAEVSEDQARELVERIRGEVTDRELRDPLELMRRVSQIIEEEITVSGPIRVTPGRRHLVALVGPTGVGKTTTIAKLAANYRLKQKLKVGLITVDTYRIAAVEQLRTYADIIELPMEVVSTPREMREAIGRLAGLDLILMDTAGRSPRDEVKIQELKAFLSEAEVDEVHLVLSSVSGAAGLCKTAQQFAPVGTTALLLTKLDEANGLGNLLPLLRGSQLPLSYLTNGQNVPDDIEVADSRRLARAVLGIEEREPLHL